MAGWGDYVVAWVVFLLTHAVPVRPPVKPWIVKRLGRAGFGLAYSALSIAVLVWLIGAAARAPYIEFWPRAEWQNHLTLMAMILACLIVALAAFRPNPFSFGGWRNEQFDRSRPGIVGLVRHPILAALGLWALGHVAPNGDLAHVVMFGGFAAFATLGMVMIDRRLQRTMGSEIWRTGLPIATLRGLPGPLRWLTAAAILTGLIALHPLVIGVSAVW